MTRFFLAALGVALLASAATAQPARFDPAQLDAFFNRPPKVEVNLRGAMLRLAAGAMEDDEDGTGEMLRGLRSILVRVYALDDARDGLASQLDTIERDMAASGWSTLVRVRPDGDDDDDVWVYVRDAGDRFDGMTVVSLDHGSNEASFVVIDGPLDPDKIGGLGGRFGIPDVGDTEMSDAEMDRIEADAERAAESAVIRDELRRAEAEVRRAEAEARRAEADARRAESDALRTGRGASGAAKPTKP